jgi:hypothetical protein
MLLNEWWDSAKKLVNGKHILANGTTSQA